MKITLVLTIAVAWLTVAVGQTAVDANEIVVPDDHPTIAAALVAAHADPTIDTVFVKPGSYEETSTLTITRDHLTLRGEGSDLVLIDRTTAGGNFATRGLQVSGATGITLEGFTLMNSPGFGLKLELTSDLTVRDVVATDNGRTGIDLNGIDDGMLTDVAAYDNGGAGIALRDSTELLVENAETSGNAWGGLALWALDAENLTDVAVVDSAFFGELAGVIAQHPGEFDVVLTGNRIEDNLVGVFIDPTFGAVDATGITLFFNDIVGNEDAGVLNLGDGTLDATENYWGHASGPGGPDGRTNPAGKTVGKGDAIIGDVDFNPWLRQSIDHPSRR